MGDYLLPAERRRGNPASVARTGSELNRSVRSLRAQFERGTSSVPPAPMRTKRDYKHSTQTELAKYLSTKKKQDSTSPISDNTTASPNSANDKAGLNHLIERFNTPQRVPFLDRDNQPIDGSLHSDNTDTFGDLAHDHPKTDPGALESFRRQIEVSTGKPITTQQSLREMTAFATHQSAEVRESAVAVAVPANTGLRRSLSAMGVNELQGKPDLYAFEEPAPSEEPDSDWGAYDSRIQELFSEAQTTAERAVQCDEQEEYGQALDLYWSVVGLYYKVMPFLTPEEAMDVNKTVKMYTKRCEAIRQAFEDDPDYEDIDILEPDHQVIDIQRQEIVVESPRIVESKSHRRIQHCPDQSRQHLHRRPSEVDGASHRRPPQQPNYQPATSQSQYHHRKEPVVQRTKAPVERGVRVEHAIEVVERPGPAAEPKPSTQENDVALMRSRLPDYNSNMQDAVPEAPRGPQAMTYGGAAASSAAAHRNSLSRPVSRTAIRKATQSVSRERMLEIEEKMRLMQSALHNFTVKRKHLGPARALELQMTSLNVKTFGELKRLEPIQDKLVHTWTSELEVLLGMLEEIKENQGRGYALREDIGRHLPSLKSCDRNVIQTMASFKALKGEIEYVDSETHGGSAKGGRNRKKWWVKVPVVKRGGLSKEVRKIVDDAEKEMGIVFKITHEINLDVVRNMAVPSGFVDQLPKHARHIIPKELKEALMTWGMFKIGDFMRDRHCYNKEKAKELCSALEKVALVWESKTVVKSFLSRTLDTLDIRGERGKNIMNALRRCQNAIRDLRREFPTMQQTDLDMAKITENEDIGHAGLEAYSRALESRAARVLSRVREIIEADDEEKGVISAR